MTSERLFTIVVPTYQRRDVLLASMASWARLDAPWPVELVVVVDGSTDGTADAARAVELPFPVTVVEQPNRGAAAARNRGAAAATGRYLLFLDDDMVADAGLLVAHEAVLARGADAVVGHIPLHPDSPRTLLTQGVERWARLRHARLSGSRGQLALGDLLTGQLSVRAEVFAASGGFDEEFNAGGAFGAEDTDFLYRLLCGGAAVRYAPDAVTYQRYVVAPDRYLQQWREAGRADAVLARKHPELAPVLAEQHGAGTAAGRLLSRWAPAVPPRVGRALARPVVTRARAGRTDLPTRWLFARIRDAGYWRGLADGGGLPRGTAPVVLAYHAIEDVDDPQIGRWCVPPEAFERQLDALSAAGVRWIGLADLLASLDGTELPPRSVLLTFDDGYASLTGIAAELARRGIRPTVFLVSEQLGGWNEWDARAGAAKLPLLSTADLQRLAERGWALGSHTRSHAHLCQADDAALDRELSGALEQLRAAGLPVAPVLAHPYGEHDVRVRAAARRAGYRAAFALEGRRPGSRGRYAVPRIEVTRGTAPEALVAAVLRPPLARSQETRRELAGLGRWTLHAIRVRGR